jgi:hypothetical protein
MVAVSHCFAKQHRFSYEVTVSHCFAKFERISYTVAISHCFPKYERISQQIRFCDTVPFRKYIVIPFCISIDK